MTDINRQRFKNNIERRVNGVFNALRLLNNCSNVKNYEYTDNEALQIVQEVRAATELCLSSFTTRRFGTGFKIKFKFIPIEPDNDEQPVVDATPDISQLSYPTTKRKFSVRFRDGKEKFTYSAYSIVCAVVAPHGDSYRVCDWFKTVREAHQYISEHPSIGKAIVTPTTSSKSY